MILSSYLNLLRDTLGELGIIMPVLAQTTPLAIYDWLILLRETLEKLGIVMPALQPPSSVIPGPGMSVSQDFTRQVSTEIILATGQPITRKRLKTQTPPPSYDFDYGEVLNRSEEEFDSIVYTGKVFFNPEEKLLFTDFGGLIEASAIVHFPADCDLRAGDFLIIDGNWFSIRECSIAPLRGYIACAVVRIPPR